MNVQEQSAELHQLEGKCKRISEKEFWDDMHFEPILRLGYSGGPGAVFHGEAQRERACAVTGKPALARVAHFAIRHDQESRFYRHRGDVTLDEFKAICDEFFPDIEICDWNYGSQLWPERKSAVQAKSMFLAL